MAGNFTDFYNEYVTPVSEEPNKDDFITCQCPFIENHANDDEHPSAGFSIKTGVFNCHCCGSFSAARFLAKVNDNLTFQEATTIIDSFRRENELIEHTKIWVKERHFSPRLDRLYKESLTYDISKQSIILDYCESRGLELETLIDAHVTYLPKELTHWKKESIVFPYMIDGRIVGLRYRDAYGNKGGEPGCHFTLWGLDSLDDTTYTIVMVQEGESDRLRAMQEVKKFGLPMNVVSTPTSAFRKEWVREFEDIEMVLLVPQADEASQKLVIGAENSLGAKLHVLQLPWKRKQVGKDTCEWLVYNKPDEFKLLIELIINSVTRIIVSGRELSEMVIEEKDHYIQNLIHKNELFAITGHPKSKKTWIMFNLIRTLIKPGENFLGIPDMIGPTKIPNILFYEEEGSLKEFRERVYKVLGDTPYKDHVYFGHHMGVKLDDPVWIDKIQKHIDKYEISIICYDPFQRIHDKEENDASSQAVIWSNIHKLNMLYPDLTQGFIHHWSKSYNIRDGWKAMRGSIRMAGEVDTGIFVESSTRSDAEIVKIKIEGRAIETPRTKDGKDIFTTVFNKHTGLLTYEVGISDSVASPDKIEAMIDELKDRTTWTLDDCARHFVVTTKSITRWVKKSENRILITKPAPGKPAILYLPGN
jgi:hypothetical protein